MRHKLKVTNDKIRNMLFDLAKEAGISVCENYQANSGKYQTFVLDTDHWAAGVKVLGNAIAEPNTTLDKLIETIEDFGKNKKVFTFEINKGYIATVDVKTKMVRINDAIEIPFEKVNALHKLVNSK